MRLGAMMDAYGVPEDPQAYFSECGKRGYRSVPCPKVDACDSAKLRAIRDVFARSDILIAEVQTWVNPIDRRPELRRRNLQTIIDGLNVADEVNAVCCVTVAGTHDTSETAASDSAHPDNFSDATFDAVVQWIRYVLQEAAPRRAKLTLEISPWTLLDGPEIYREIIDAVDDPRFAVHLDPANAICNAHRYWNTTGLLNRCFDLLGPWIVACHAKDISQGPVADQVSLQEVLPGKGVLDYRTYLRRIEAVSRDTPLLIEHLRSAEQYAAAASFIRATANEVGVTS